MHVKVRLCQRFFNTGECVRRNECWYAHTLAELESSARRNFKTRSCHAFQSGSCKFGACCTFAHGNAQLRFPDDPVVLPPVPAINGARSSPRERVGVPVSRNQSSVSAAVAEATGPSVTLPTPLPKQQQQQQQRDLVDELAVMSGAHRGLEVGGQHIENSSHRQLGSAALFAGSSALFADSADPIFQPNAAHSGWGRPVAAVGAVGAVGGLGGSHGSNGHLEALHDPMATQMGLWDPVSAPAICLTLGATYTPTASPSAAASSVCCYSITFCNWCISVVGASDANAFVVACTLLSC